MCFLIPVQMLRKLYPLSFRSLINLSSHAFFLLSEFTYHFESFKALNTVRIYSSDLFAKAKG